MPQKFTDLTSRTFTEFAELRSSPDCAYWQPGPAAAPVRRGGGGLRRRLPGSSPVGADDRVLPGGAELRPRLRRRRRARPDPGRPRPGRRPAPGWPTSSSAAASPPPSPPGPGRCGCSATGSWPRTTSGPIRSRGSRSRRSRARSWRPSRPRLDDFELLERGTHGAELLVSIAEKRSPGMEPTHAARPSRRKFVAGRALSKRHRTCRKPLRARHFGFRHARCRSSCPRVKSSRADGRRRNRPRLVARHVRRGCSFVKWGDGCGAIANGRVHSLCWSTLLAILCSA